MKTKFDIGDRVIYLDEYLGFYIADVINIRLYEDKILYTLKNESSDNFTGDIEEFDILSKITCKFKITSKVKKEVKKEVDQYRQKKKLKDVMLFVKLKSDIKNIKAVKGCIYDK